MTLAIILLMVLQFKLFIIEKNLFFLWQILYRKVTC